MLRGSRGLSLIELLVALAVSGVLLTSIYTVLIQQHKAYVLQEHITMMRQQARLGMDVMVNEIRMAGFDPRGSAGAGIVEATAHRLHFTSDLDCNGRAGNITGEEVMYALDQQHELSRQGFIQGTRSGGLQPVASDILSLHFCYIVGTDSDCDPTPRPEDVPYIRAVHITLTAMTKAPDPQYVDLTVPPAYKHHRTTTLTALVYLRNLGLSRTRDDLGPCTS